MIPRSALYKIKDERSKIKDEELKRGKGAKTQRQKAISFFRNKLITCQQFGLQL